jgi:hypothetical protein
MRHPYNSRQQCVVSYNPMVLPENLCLQKSCKTHERNPVWRDMGQLEQLEKTDGMCALKAHRCTVGFNTEHCCANLPKKRKRAKERMCQKRSLRNKIETTISMKTYPVFQQILSCTQWLFGCRRFDLCHTIFRIQYDDMLCPCVCYWVLGFFQTLQITQQYSFKYFTGTSGIPVHFLLRDLVPERPSFCRLSCSFAYVIDRSLRNGNEFHLQHVSALSFLLKYDDLAQINVHINDFCPLCLFKLLLHSLDPCVHLCVSLTPGYVTACYLVKVEIQVLVVNV